MAQNLSGNRLHVALVRPESDAPVLLTIETSDFEVGPPAIQSASLNEGLIGLAPAQPTAFSLARNVPNPFNPRTTIRFGLPAPGLVHLAVYSPTGQVVRTLVDARMGAGHHSVVWNGRDDVGRNVASGVYVCRLTGRFGTQVRSMVLLR